VKAINLTPEEDEKGQMTSGFCNCCFMISEIEASNDIDATGPVMQKLAVPLMPQAQ
jgi:hypothetical protein